MYSITRLSLDQVFHINSAQNNFSSRFMPLRSLNNGVFFLFFFFLLFHSFFRLLKVGKKVENWKIEHGIFLCFPTLQKLIIMILIILIIWYSFDFYKASNFLLFFLEKIKLIQKSTLKANINQELSQKYHLSKLKPNLTINRQPH